MLLNIKCVFWFSPHLSPKKCCIGRIIQWNIINVSRSSRTVPIILTIFQLNLNSLKKDFQNILKNQISLKLDLWETKYSMRMGRRTDVAKLIVSFRNFTNALKNSQDGAEFDCSKSERETIGERERDERSRREMAENKKQTQLSAWRSFFFSPLPLSLSLSLYLSIFNNSRASSCEIFNAFKWLSLYLLLYGIFHL